MLSAGAITGALTTLPAMLKGGGGRFASRCTAVQSFSGSRRGCSSRACKESKSKQELRTTSLRDTILYIQASFRDPNAAVKQLYEELAQPNYDWGEPNQGDFK